MFGVAPATYSPSTAYRVQSMPSPQAYPVQPMQPVQPMRAYSSSTGPRLYPPVAVNYLQQARITSNAFLLPHQRRYAATSPSPVSSFEVVTDLGQAALLVSACTPQSSVNRSYRVRHTPYVEEQDRHIESRDRLVAGIAGAVAVAACTSSLSAAFDDRRRAEEGLRRVEEFERQLNSPDFQNAPITPHLRAVVASERALFTKVKNAAMETQALSISAIASGVLVVLGALIASPALPVGFTLMGLGVLGLIGTGIAAAIIGIRNAIRGEDRLSQALSLQQRLDEALTR